MVTQTFFALPSADLRIATASRTCCTACTYVGANVRARHTRDDAYAALFAAKVLVTPLFAA